MRFVLAASPSRVICEEEDEVESYDDGDIGDKDDNCDEYDNTKG
jgi:hypothetical protein